MSFGAIAAGYFTLAGPGGTGSLYADLVLTYSPLLYWRLGDTSGTTTDSSGNGRNGTYINSPLLGQTPLVIEDDGCSVEFDDDNHQRAVLASAAWMNVSEMTITCLYLHTSDGNGIQMLASRYWDDTQDVSWFLYRQDREFKFYYRGSGGQEVIVASGVIGEMGYTYYVAAYCGASGAGIRVYKLGVLAGSATGAGYALNGSNRPFVVAGCDAATGYNLSGVMQEVSYFGAVLSVAAIDGLAAQATAPQPKWLNRTAGTAPRNGTGTHTLTFPATSAGSYMVAVVSGAVISTAVTPGWTKRLSAADNSEMAVFTLSASSGETSLQLTHNGSNYPINYVVYEFPAGTAWVTGAGNPVGEIPDLTGLPGTPVTVFGAFSMSSGSVSDPTPATAWNWHWMEDMDVMTPSDGVTDGVYTAIGWISHVTRTSISPATEGFYGGVYTISAPFNYRTNVVFALSIP